MKYKYPGLLPTETLQKKTEKEPTFREWAEYILDALKNGKAVMLHKPKYLKGKRTR